MCDRLALRSKLAGISEYISDRFRQREDFPNYAGVRNNSGNPSRKLCVTMCIARAGVANASVCRLQIRQLRMFLAHGMSVEMLWKVRWNVEKYREFYQSIYDVV
jgi:hypothetical protein